MSCDQECLPLPLLGINQNQEPTLAAWSQAQFSLTSNVKYPVLKFEFTCHLEVNTYLKRFFLIGMWSTMNLSIGNSGRKGTSTSVMLLGRYMQFQKTSQPIFQLTSMFHMAIPYKILLTTEKKNYNASMMCVRPILHKYANEDVSLGSWFIGLEVNHIDERNMCCGTPPGPFPQTWTMLLVMHSFFFVLSKFWVTKLHRLRVERASWQCLCSVFWLELQRHMQVGREDQGCPCSMWWRRLCCLECSNLAKKKPTARKYM